MALVAGSSRGIGRAVAGRLAREGAHLILYARGREALDRAAEEIRRDAGVEVLGVPADVLELTNVARLVAEAVARPGRLDIVRTGRSRTARPTNGGARSVLRSAGRRAEPDRYREGLALHGEQTVATSETALVTERGCERITQFPRQLFVKQECP